MANGGTQRLAISLQAVDDETPSGIRITTYEGNVTLDSDPALADVAAGLKELGESIVNSATVLCEYFGSAAEPIWALTAQLKRQNDLTEARHQAAAALLSE